MITKIKRVENNFIFTFTYQSKIFVRTAYQACESEVTRKRLDYVMSADETQRSYAEYVVRNSSLKGSKRDAAFKFVKEGEIGTSLIIPAKETDFLKDIKVISEN